MSSHRGGQANYILFVVAAPFGLVGLGALALALVFARTDPGGAQVVTALGAAFLVLAGLLVGVGFLVRARARRRLPEEAAEPSRWAAWAFSQRSGHWKGLVDGRTLVAQRAYRKYGHGNMMVFLGAATRSRSTLIRRRGVKATVGRGIDAIAGATVTSAASLGYPDMELSALEPEWASCFLIMPDVADAIRAVCADDAGAEVLAWSVRPGVVGLTVGFPTAATVSPATAATWIASLQTLAAAAESVPPPANPVAPRWTERLLLDPDRARRVAFLIVFGIVGVLFLVASVAMGLLMWLRP